MKSGTDSTRFAGFRFVAWAVFLLVALVLSGEHSFAQQADLVIGPATPPPYGATHSITTAGTVVISGAASVTFIAGSVIKLEPGFHARAANTGLTFQAIIGTAETINFPAISMQTSGTPLTLSASASSGLPVTFSSSTSSVCTVSGSTVSFLMAGTCVIVASGLGSNTYAPASPVQQTITVAAAPLPATATKDYIYVNGRLAVIENH